MTNRFTASPPDELIRAKLNVLLETANRLYQEGGLSVKEDVLDAYNEAIDLFFESFDNSILGVTYPIMLGMPADPIDYNVFTRAILYDLQALFAQIGAVDRLVSMNFNSIIALKDRLLSISRRIGGKTGDYLLYADPSLGDGFFFGNSFHSARYLDLESDLVEDELCHLNQEEGVILLPLDGSPETATVAKYIINDSSNGELGNNHQIGVMPHRSLEALGDNEPNTWVEYERVTTIHSQTPLVFDLTIVLKEPKIINHIHVDPIQFGTPTPVKITALETSIDGKEFVSIRKEVPIADFLAETEEEVFELSGKTSKYSGEGYYSFLPRRTQYIHIVLKQNSPYAIDTPNGTRLRYAIGLKDINIYGRKFKEEGSIVSTPINTHGDVTKLALWASENPIDVSDLADIRHDVSHNDGATWLSIQPQNRDYVVYPEILNFNNFESDSITTDGEIPSIRHKIVMHRNPGAFDGDVVLKQEKLNTIDLVSVTGLSPFNLELQHEPISQSVHISIPVYGSFSCPRGRSNLTSQYLSPPMDLDFIETMLTGGTAETIRFKLPYKNIPNLAHKIRVFIDGAQWAYCSTDNNSLLSIDTDSRVYFLNQGGRELQFVHINDSGNKFGKIPGTGAKIQICLDGDNPRLIQTDAGYTLQLEGSADGFKKYVGIVTALGLDPNVGEEENIEEPFSPQETFRFRGHQPVINLNLQTAQVGDTTSPKKVVSDIGGDGAEDESSETSWGSIPPIYDVNPDSFGMKEYSVNNPATPLSDYDTNRRYHNQDDPDAREDGYVPFVDGSSEFYSDNQKKNNRWTFDPYTGVIYLSAVRRGGNYEIAFYYRRRKFKVLGQKDWDFYKNTITGQVDTSKVVLKPEAVRQFEINKPLQAESTSSQLVQKNYPRHDWWAQKIVQRSIKLSEGIIKGEEGETLTPVEVKYIDGSSELQNTTKTKELVLAQPSGLAVKVFQLTQVNETHRLRSGLSFDPVIEYPNPIMPSQFVQQVQDSSEITTAGDWWLNTDEDSSDYGQVRVHTAAEPLRTHSVSYEYEDINNGIDKRGLYSVDYDQGVIYFATQVTEGAYIVFNVTMYSAFYNFSEVVQGRNIESIEEKAKMITLDVNYAEKFLKEVSPQNPRPRFVKVGYDYYKKSTESMKDLEPYFSPICKDIAIRAITKDFLGVLLGSL